TGRRLFILGNSFSKPIPLNPFPFLYIPQFSRFTLLVYLTLSQDAHIREHYDQPLSLADLTAIAGLSVAQLERHCKRIFQLTPRQMIHKARLGAASQLLAGDAPITEIALRCGYTDHSAFSRQFKALTGLSPSQYRETHRQPRKA
ncbi:helix-turn-helix domain-containing protein, partial [Pseudomonas aeruginosa]